MSAAAVANGTTASGYRLSRRLLGVLFAVLTSISVALLVMIVWIYKNQLVDEHARASMQVNELLQASLENAMLKRDIAGLREIVDRLGTQHDIGQVMILNPEREVRFSSSNDLLGKIINDGGVTTALQSHEPQTAFLTGPDGGEWLRSVNPVQNQPQCKECHGAATDHPVNGLLVVDYDATGIRRTAMRTAGLLGVSGLLVLAASGFGLWLSLKRLVLGPVDSLRLASNRLASGELDARADIYGDDEIASCASAFNQMAGRLETTIGEVAAAERFLQMVIDSIPDGVRVIGDDFTVFKANKAYCAQVAQSPANVIGKKCYASSHGRKEPCPETLVTCPVVALREDSRDTVKFTDMHQRGKDENLFVEVSAARVELPNGAGSRPFVVESIRDLSQQVEHSQKHRLSEIGLLATGIAHEIHNPLSSIELALSAIRESLAGRKDAKSEHAYIDIAKTEIDKCLSVTDGLMRLSEPPHSPELVVLEKVVSEVMSLLAFQVEKGRVVVEYDIAPALRILAADSDVRMIVVNLAQNAIHSMPDGGSLRIEGRLLGDKVALTFKDKGIGIAHEHLDKIFLPFWTRRADGSTGRGLGLSICKAIVERYDGTISVSSVKGKGTVFTVTFPSADAEYAGSAAA